MKKSLLWLVVLTLVVSMIAAFSLNGCKKEAAPAEEEVTEEAAPAEEEAAPAEEEEVVMHKAGIATMFAHQYWDVMTSGVAEAMGSDWEIIELIAEFDVEKQINDVDDMIVQGAEAMFIEPCDSTAIKGALEACQAADIPVVILDAPAVDDNLVVAMVTTDNYMCGVQCAEDLIERMDGEPCKVVILGWPIQEATRLREVGFTDTIAEHDNFEIVVNQVYTGLQEKAQEIMENAVQSEPEINAVFAVNETAIFAAIAVLEGVDRLEGTYLYAVNGAAAEIEMIKAGKQTGTSAQLPYEMGYQGGQAMIDYLSGEEVEHIVLIAPLLVTMDNGTIDTYEPSY